MPLSIHLDLEVIVVEYMTPNVLEEMLSLIV